VSLAKIGDHRIALYRRVAAAAANPVRAHDQ
jgi:hypothetical protein